MHDAHSATLPTHLMPVCRPATYVCLTSCQQQHHHHHPPDAAYDGVKAAILQGPAVGVSVEVPHKEAVEALVAPQLGSIQAVTHHLCRRSNSNSSAGSSSLVLLIGGSDTPKTFPPAGAVLMATDVCLPPTCTT